MAKPTQEKIPEKEKDSRAEGGSGNTILININVSIIIVDCISYNEFIFQKHL